MLSVHISTNHSIFNNIIFIYQRNLTIKFMLLFEIPSFAAHCVHVVDFNKFCNLTGLIETPDGK